MDKDLWLASCFLIGAGILLLTGGGCLRLIHNFKEPLKGQVKARVVELLLEDPGRKESASFFRNSYYPVFEFYVNGKLYRVRYPRGSYPSRFHVNQEISLNYDPSNPLDFCIAEKNLRQAGARLLYAAGVACVFAGFIIFVIFARRG